MRNTKVRMLTECAVMVALSFALSCIKLFSMPLGGSVTLVSMLPVMLIGIKYGTAVGVGTGFVYSLTQLAQALVEGDVFPYCETFGVLMLCLFFDYLVPFTALGLSGIFKDIKLLKNDELNSYLGFVLAVFVRFICHLITGIVIWGQWAPEGMGKFIYSLAYNGSFIGIDLVLCLAVAAIMLRHKEIKRILGLGAQSAE